MRVWTLALVALFAACPKPKKEVERKTTTVVVAGGDLTAGREVSMLDLARATLPQECATPDTLNADTMKDVIGQTLVHSLPKGAPVRRQDVTRDLACQHGPMAPVVTASKDIKKGETFTEENVTQQVIPEEHATATVVRTILDANDPKIAEKIDLWKKRVVGKKCRTNLRKGDVVRVSDFEG